METLNKLKNHVSLTTSQLKSTISTNSKEVKDQIDLARKFLEFFNLYVKYIGVERTIRLISFTSIVGLLYLCKISCNALYSAYIHFSPSTNLLKYGAHKGAYCVITGGSDGIGRALAIEGASRGFNIVIIGFTKSKLEAVQKEIKAMHAQIDVKIIPQDCSASDAVPNIKRLCENLDVGILINNVGMVNKIPSPLIEQSAAFVSKTINLNAKFTILLSQAMIPILKRRTKSLIMNISSFVSLLPASFYVTYCSTKGFVNSFSNSLGNECQIYNIDVQNIRPAHVVTKMSMLDKPSLFKPTAETYAKSVFNKAGKDVQCPYLPHAIQEAIATTVPSFLVRKGWFAFASGLNKEMKSKGIKEEGEEVASDENTKEVDYEIV